MMVLDHSFERPSVNLALDEVLLRDCESESGEDMLRFWESPVPFVVLGLTQRVTDEVRVERCEADGIPILRRCSAGGCVLQGPGCINYTLVLNKSRHPGIESIQGSYRYILEKVIAAFPREGLRMAGISDIAKGELKISGNAQRRAKNTILHHGTILYAADMKRVSEYLCEPSDRPDYRGERLHEGFITNVGIGREAVVSGLLGAFGAGSSLADVPERFVQGALDLAEEKYESVEWIYRK